METAQAVVKATTIQRRFRRPWTALRGVPVFPFIIMVGFIFCGFFANAIAPYSPDKMDLIARLTPPAFVPGGSWAHILGTDTLGRDILSRMIVGARVSLIVSLLSILLAGGVGTTIGMVAGYVGGLTDSVLMRITDAALAFPGILIALLLAVALGPSLVTVLLAMALMMWAFYARMMRGEVLSLREAGFVAQARLAGCSPLRIIFTHIFPNIVNTLLVMATLQIGVVILIEASLSFLGAGVPPPTPSWGSMVSDGKDLFDSAWWIALFPGIAIALVVLAGNFMGDWIRDRLDPKLRQL